MSVSINSLSNLTFNKKKIVKAKETHGKNVNDTIINKEMTSWDACCTIFLLL